MDFDIKNLTASAAVPELPGQTKNRTTPALPRTNEAIIKTNQQIMAENKEQKENIKQYLNDLSRVAMTFDRQLKFSFNENLNQVIVKVIDGNTDKIIREIPPEEIQKLHLRIKEAIGLLFDEQI